MSDKILKTVAKMPKVMPQIEIPVQAGDDEVLTNMKRGYTSLEYRQLILRIREIIPDAAIHNDIIVGFPGETREQFQNTLELVSDLEFDKVHIARYSPRPGTVSARRLIDNVPDEEKRRRFHQLEAVQKEISKKKNHKWMHDSVEVLVEDKHKGRWRGRTPHGKLVFFNSPADQKGKLVQVRITHAGAWSMSGEHISGDTEPLQANKNIPLSILSPT